MGGGRGEHTYVKTPHDLILASNSNQVPWGFIVYQSQSVFSFFYTKNPDF